MSQDPDRRWIAAYVAVLVGGFIPLYLLTRSSILTGDGFGFIESARGADPAEFHYGEPTHFLQVPLVRLVWRLLDGLGLPVPLETIFLGFSLIGTLAAIVFLGLIAAELLRSRTAAWLAAVLFGTSLHAWTQWNGELYGLALGFVTAALFLTLRGKILAPALLWALSVLSHVEFAIAAPAFIVAVVMGQPAGLTTDQKLRKALPLFVVAATSTIVLLLAGGWALHKWSDSSSMSAWLWRAYQARQKDTGDIEAIRAIKGLLTAHSVAGHYWRDILTWRGAFDNPLFVLASTVGFLVLAATGIFIASAAWSRRLALFAVVWFLPVHLFLNWRFVPTAEKYHAAALPGFILLVVGGLTYLATRLPRSGRNILYVGFVVAHAGLNLFGALLPMQEFGRETDSAARAIRQLHAERGGKAVFVTCDNPRAIGLAGVTFLRIRSIWKGTVPEIQDTIRSWVEARRREGEALYVLDRWCRPDEWITLYSKAPFDLFFLERDFQIVPTSVTAVPVYSSAATSPFSWRWGDVVRLDPR